ncbi:MULTISPECIES: cyclopropane fatty acyl phospholipid synthase [unclassified Beijerinckia]|uniref:cyclopropane fatty acyl phospholipid synthase n=1 Tax=unclassified Beijerinckia TaxID=2638183 RepID=UPI0008954AA0|nr:MULTISPECIES: cyclopropane fatty acyl phospholipid synthase [unclassified Beijerinckia]MDH7798445.1 cyclopropane-fatty-acyl-phospholipid synthase [Beijerinckia sp. GAS462]SED21126.1 cyclopropane-fatty-acyl-phospholipid synthase [Beijerinckia sp. 28-YEA-48]
MSAETTVKNLLAIAGIEINGNKPWDIKVHDDRFYARSVAQGSLGFGESYMDGWWDCEKLDQLFDRLVGSRLSEKIPFNFKTAWLVLVSKIQNRQNMKRAFIAADVHYDLPVQIFEATFDKRLTGSCGYWKEAKDLDACQDAKLDLICRKIGLKQGQRVFDIGCGWGAFMGFAAEKYGAHCEGVTVSKEQVAYAMNRYANLSVKSTLMDYRNATGGPYDHLVSMGMFEHVGSKNYRAYFETARRLIKEDGLFCLHTIWGNEPEPAIDPWIDKYIFPNGVLPTVGQVTSAVHQLFVVEDVHNFGPYYDLTLMAWNDKFQSHRADMARDYGERFCRMWEYYLLCCAGGFRSRGISVGQFVLSPHGVREGYTAVR